MTTTLRWLLVAVLTLHGLIHLLGVVKGFALADVAQLSEPITAWAAALWLLAAVLVLGAAALLAAGAPVWWWAIALGAAITSQVAISTSWNDARAGTIVNLVLVLAAASGFVSEGPASFHAEYRERVAQALSEPTPPSHVLDESDLADLPGPLAAYVRSSGAVGKPRIVNFHATNRAGWHRRDSKGGRPTESVPTIWSTETSPWMAFITRASIGRRVTTATFLTSGDLDDERAAECSRVRGRCRLEDSVARCPLDGLDDEGGMA